MPHILRHWLLAHGAWHGSWIWDEIHDRMAGMGIVTSAIDLPGVGSAPGAHGLAGHAAASATMRGWQPTPRPASRTFRWNCPVGRTIEVLRELTDEL
jgi:hypothetical protein